MVLPGRVRQVPPPRNRPKRIVPRLVSVGSRRVHAANYRDSGGRSSLFIFRYRLALSLHRLDAHLGGRLRHRHIRRRCWLMPITRCNDNGNRRRNQQRSPADSYYHPYLHSLTSFLATLLPYHIDCITGGHPSPHTPHLPCYLFSALTRKE